MIDQRARAVYLAGAAAGFALLGDSALYAVLPVAKGDLDLTPLEVGVLLSVNRLMRLLINEPAGVLVKRAGPGPMLVLALALASATTFACGRLAGAFAAFVAARIAWTFAWSLIRHAANTAVLAAEPARRGELLGSFRSLSRVGSLVAVVVGAWLCEKVGFARGYDILALATLPGIAIAALAVAHAKAPLEPAPVKANEPGEERGASRLRFALCSLGGLGVHAAGSSLLLATASLAVKELAHGSATVSVLGVAIGLGTLGGLATGARWVGDIGAGPLAGGLVDRLGGKPVVAVAGLASAALLAACSLADGPLRFAAAAAGAFLAMAVLLAALDALAAHEAARAGTRREAWLGRYFVAVDAGSAVGPLAGSALAESVGLPWLHASGAVVSLVVALVALGSLTSERGERRETRSTPPS